MDLSRQETPQIRLDPFALLILIGTIAATLALRVGVFKVMIGGAVLGVLRSQFPVSVLTRHF